MRTASQQQAESGAWTIALRSSAEQALANEWLPGPPENLGAAAKTKTSDDPNARNTPLVQAGTAQPPAPWGHTPRHL